MIAGTAGSLDSPHMKSIKTIVLAKFGGKKSEDKELLWAHCKTAIGQKCKQLRAARRTRF